MAWLSASSFVNGRAKYDLYSYDPISAPVGVRLQDASEILPRGELFFAAGSYSAFSNVFRYNLLYSKGGWWVDMDVYNTGLDYPRQEIIYAEEEDGSINCGQIRFPPQHPILRYLIEESRKIDKSKLTWGDLGPKLFTKAVGHFDLYNHKVARETLYPLHYLEVYKVLFPNFRDEVRQKCAASPFIHLFGAMYSEYGFIVDLHRPLAGSFLDALYERNRIYDKFELVDNPFLVDTTNKYLCEGWVRKLGASNNVILPLVS